MLGNWREKSSFVFDVKRSTSLNGGLTEDISKSGYFLSFSPYWNNVGNQWLPNTGSSANLWRWTKQISLIGIKGEEIENKDALGKFHSAQFGYLKSLPVAVASNAKHREIYTENFEDFDFSLGCKSDCDICYSANLPFFSFRKFISSNSLDKQNGHTGNISYKLTQPIQLVTETMLNEPTNIYTRTLFGEFKLTNNYLQNGFLPIPGKKYILSCWIKDNQKNNKAQINLFVNGVLKTKPEDRWPLIEGWKRVEIEFIVDANKEFSIKFEPISSQVLLDDIRIYPSDGQFKSYVYHSSNLRLLAELDENNFATIYDYDNEGIPIRVRKETEKGIMTIKETRSSNVVGNEFLVPSYQSQDNNFLVDTGASNNDCSPLPIWVNVGDPICIKPDNIHNNGTRLQTQINQNPYSGYETRTIILDKDLAACPVPQDWQDVTSPISGQPVQKCESGTSGYNTGRILQLQQNKNPFSLEGLTTRYRDAGLNLGACPVNPDWENVGVPQCTKPNNVHNNGHQWQQQRDKNPYSNQSPKIVDLGMNTSACPIVADWVATTTKTCQVLGGYATGYVLQEYKDQNPYSSTYNQSNWVNTGINTSVCPVPQDWQDVTSPISGQPVQKCESGTSGYNTGRILQLQQNKNPFSLEGLTTRYRDAGLNLGA
ncbi:MAG: hypothetical protein ACK52I_21490, partial [Pseudomonadota bacterium]